MSLPVPDSGTLANIASVIAAFGVAMLFFRVQREITMRNLNEPNWIPWADWLLIIATLLSLLLVILPLVAADPTSNLYKAVPSAACATSAILIAGYPFAILAHYRLIFGKKLGDAQRCNPELSELVIVFITSLLAVGAFVWTLCARIH